MGARGSALDNAVCEAFFASLKKELTRRRSWPTRNQLQTAIFAWIEAWYNRRRLHSTLGYRSPESYENGSLSERGASLAASRLAYSRSSTGTTLRGPAPKRRNRAGGGPPGPR